MTTGMASVAPWYRVPTGDPHTGEATATLELAIPLLDDAAGGHVEGIVGDSDPFAAVQQVVERGGFDEVIISTLPARVSRWLRRALPRRVERLGLPVYGGHGRAIRVGRIRRSQCRLPC